jgi:hypothetical protein
MGKTTEAHLVVVTTDDQEQQLWVTAGPRKEAINQVLNAVPAGWSAFLLDTRLQPDEVEILKLKSGEVRKISCDVKRSPRRPWHPHFLRR